MKKMQVTFLMIFAKALFPRAMGKKKELFGKDSEAFWDLTLSKTTNFRLKEFADNILNLKKMVETNL